MSSKLLEFQEAPVESIPVGARTVRASFNSQKTKSVEFRLQQLRKLYWALTDNQELIIEACKRDLGKATFEVYLTEIDWCRNDIIFVCDNLEKWIKDESAPDIPLMNKLLRPKIRKDPLGAVLIIGTYNFPIQLAIGPLIGAIAAGCTAIVKPSENAPNAGMAVQKVMTDSLDPSSYICINGSIPQTTALLDEKWDKIFYTGSGNVAKIISKKAAETLTPVTLELGGRNPAIVTRNADIRLAARRLLWAKIHNAGQVCISQNYVLIDKAVLDAFVAEMQTASKEFFPSGAQASPDFSRVINARQFARMKAMLDHTRGKIVMGGGMDEKDRFIEPTAVLCDDVHDSMIAEESFGPIFAILPVDNLDAAIRIANEVDPTPLGAYPFGTKAETDKVLEGLRSGGASINDGFFHGSIPTLAFGGVGSSGQGAYRGKASFDCFSHRRSVTTTPGWMEGLLSVRYPPYEGKLKRFQRMSNKKPNFDREGRVRGGLLGWLWRLGAGSGKGAVVRYAIVLFVGIAFKQYLDQRAKL